MRLFPKLLVASALLALALIPTGALAAEPPTVPLDLTAIGGPQMWLRCTGPTLERCGVVSLWQQSNGVPGLQTTIFAQGGKPWEPDTKLTP